MFCRCERDAVVCLLLAPGMSAVVCVCVLCGWCVERESQMNGVVDDSPLRPAQAQPSEMMGYPAVIGLDSFLITSMASSHRIRSNPPPPTLLPNIIFFHWMTCCACSSVSARVMCFLSILLFLFFRYYINIFLTREIHYISTFLVSSISSGLFIIKALSFYFIRLIRKQQQIRRRQHQHRHNGAPSLCKRQTP